MEYQIDMSDEAEAELDAAYLYLSGRSLDSAYRWYNGAQKAIPSLSNMPRRCVLAHENSLYPNNEVRQLLYGNGKTTYRILFTIFEEDGLVRVLHFRHGARQSGRSNQTEEN